MRAIKGEYDYSDYSFLSNCIMRYEDDPKSVVSVHIKGHTLDIPEAKDLKDKIERLYISKFMGEGLSKEEAEDEFCVHVLHSMMEEEMTHVRVSQN